MPPNHASDNIFESHRNRTITIGSSGCCAIFHSSRKINPCIDCATWIGELDLPSVKRCTYIHTCNLRNLLTIYRNDAERYIREALLRVRRLLPAGVRVNEKKTRCTWATCLRSKACKSNGDKNRERFGRDRLAHGGHSSSLVVDIESEHGESARTLYVR